MDDPIQGEVEFKTDAGSYTLRVGTLEMGKLEGLFKAKGYQAIIGELNDCSAEMLIKAVTIAFARKHPKLSAEDVAGILDSASHVKVKLAIMRCLAGTVGGAEALERFDRIQAGTEVEEADPNVPRPEVAIPA
jgi:hypothetical protein